MALNDVEFLLNAEWLLARSADPGVVLIDTRPAAEYWAGHLEGARHFDPFPFHHSDTGDAGMNEFRGQLAWIFSAMGIAPRETVVFYENESGMRATRGAWLLEYMGHPSVRMLDGGLNRLAGTKLVTTSIAVAPSNFQGIPQDNALATYKYVADHLGHQEVQIFDVRSDE